MACYSCGKSIGSINQEVQSQPIENPVDTSCNMTLEGLEQIRQKLDCFLLSDLYVNTTRQEVINTQGFVISMINLSQPCRYDLSAFLNRIQHVECTLSS